jgi:hypothetical protein
MPSLRVGSLSGLPVRPKRIIRPDARGPTIAKYAIDALLIFAPLSGVMYFLFNPDAFNAFLAWLVGVL